jgi:pilus assembly protein CpaB
VNGEARSPRRAPRRWRHRLHRLLRLAGRHRRLLAATCAAASVAFAINAVRAPATGGVRVLAAARDLRADESLDPGDVTTIDLPARAVPAAVLRPAARAVTGARLTGPMRRGEPLTDVAIRRTNQWGTSGQRGSVATPVRIADAAAARLLHTGDRVDVLTAGSGDPSAAAPDVSGEGADGSAPATDDSVEPGESPTDNGTGIPGGATLVASGVRVIAVPGKASAQFAEEGALLLLETTREQARALAAVANTRLSITIVTGSR